MPRRGLRKKPAYCLFWLRFFEFSNKLVARACNTVRRGLMRRPGEPPRELAKLRAPFPLFQRTERDSSYPPDLIADLNKLPALPRPLVFSKKSERQLRGCPNEVPPAPRGTAGHPGRRDSVVEICSPAGST